MAPPTAFLLLQFVAVAPHSKLAAQHIPSHLVAWAIPNFSSRFSFCFASARFPRFILALAKSVSALKFLFQSLATVLMLPVFLSAIIMSVFVVSSSFSPSIPSKTSDAPVAGMTAKVSFVEVVFVGAGEITVEVGNTI